MEELLLPGDVPVRDLDDCHEPAVAESETCAHVIPPEPTTDDTALCMDARAVEGPVD